MYRRHLDDPVFSLKQITQTISFTFNNEKICVGLPRETYDVAGIDNVDPNNLSRIWITQYCTSMIC